MLPAGADAPPAVAVGAVPLTAPWKVVHPANAAVATTTIDPKARFSREICIGVGNKDPDEPS
jgi:hypothetical protein